MADSLRVTYEIRAEVVYDLDGTMSTNLDCGDIWELPFDEQLYALLLLSWHATHAALDGAERAGQSELCAEIMRSIREEAPDLCDGLA